MLNLESKKADSNIRINIMRLFVYLSEILGTKIIDAKGALVGHLCDVSMSMKEEVFPRADSLIVKKGLFIKEYAKIPLVDVMDKEKEFTVKEGVENIVFQKETFRPEFSLCRDLLDQQVVDTHDQKVVRVNDVHLLRVDHQLYLAHVDVGFRGLVRRLGWASFVDSIVKAFNRQAVYLKEEEFISWRHSQVLTLGRNKNVLRSAMARQKLSKIPPTQLADIMEDLDIFEKLSLFKSFNVDLQRKVFTDMVPQEKEELVDQLDDDEAGNLLENIPADEATDLLHNLPKEKTAQLMRHMHSKTSKELRKLLGFEQDSAGGLMTAEYLYLEKDATVKDAMQLIKDNVDYPGNIFHVYIVDERHKLIGASSMRRFINEEEETPLIDTCYANKIFVRTDDDVEEVALLLEKYKFSSIPVLNEDDVLQGVITIDDVMEELISLAWRKYKDQI